MITELENKGITLDAIRKVKLPNLDALRRDVEREAKALDAARKALVMAKRKALFGFSGNVDRLETNVEQAKERLARAKSALDDAQFAHETIAAVLPEAEAHARAERGVALVAEARRLAAEMNTHIEALVALQKQAEAVSAQIDGEFGEVTSTGLTRLRGLPTRAPILGLANCWRDALDTWAIAKWRTLLKECGV